MSGIDKDTAMPDPTYVPVLPGPPQRGLLPLQGLTVLAVEDSRFACEALRLMCQRAGARLRRADTLAAARAHLATYRPDVAIIDIGLPDGEGTALIADIATSQRRPVVLLATSGDPASEAPARRAGADGFLPKPIERMADFLAQVLDRLPDSLPLPAGSDAPAAPDPIALIDDLRRAEGYLATGLPQPWLTGFLAGLARQAHDPALAAALPVLSCAHGQARLRRLIRQRIAEGPPAFASAPGQCRV